MREFVLTAFIRTAILAWDAMCHHFRSVEELTEAERTEIREEHSIEELRAEYSADDLETLGITA